jgi:prepilin-type N-terminal cleavage/methylation domain-containing protein
MSRRGYSLTEVIVGIAVSSVIMAGVVSLLGTLLLRQREAGDHLINLTAMDRLASQFRRDVHAATQAAPADGAGDLRVELRLDNSHTVRYRQQSKTLVREETFDDKLVRREAFHLPPHQVRVETIGSGATTLVRLELALSPPEYGSQTSPESGSRLPAGAGEPPALRSGGRRAIFEAQLAADRRWTSGGAQ